MWWVAGFVLWLGVGWAWAQRERVLAQRNSPYNQLRVVQDGHQRILKVRQGREYIEQSRCDMRRPNRLLHQYSRLQLVGSLYPFQLKRALVVGLGGGSLSKALLELYGDLRVDSVELDPEIAQVARQYFAYQEGSRGRTVVADARAYLQQCHQPYDLIVLDAYDGLDIPGPLRTREFYQLVSQHLHPGGVCVVNLHLRSRNYHRDRVTLAGVFDHSLAFQGTGVVELVCGFGELKCHTERWSPAWGFVLEPLLKLREGSEPYDSGALPFEDGK